MNELVVLLGAGASYPGMLSVADLTQFLVGWSERCEPPPVGSGISQALLTLPYGRIAPRPLFAALRDIAARPLKNPDQLNFEQLIHVCESLATVFPLPQGDQIADRFRSLVAPFLTVATGLEHFNIPHLGFAAQKACNALLNHISEVCDRVSTSAHPQAAGLRELAAQAQLRVFSLNYDDIAWQSGVPFYDGFVDGRFQSVYPWPLDRHGICQLHGSVLWGPIPLSERPPSPAVPRKFKNRRNATDARVGMISSNLNYQDGHEGSNVGMITGLRKADRILHRPYGTYFHVMREALLRASRWLIIGYGFGDPHINELLAQARENWLNVGHKQKILIVDYYDFPFVWDGYESAEPGKQANELIARIVGQTFPTDLDQFLAGPAWLQQNAINQISEQVAVWLHGAERAFTSDQTKVTDWLVL